MSKPARYTTVTIDGARYVPADATQITEAERKLLSEVYGALWTEAYYDQSNESTRKFARPLADKMSELNKTMGFKE